MKEIQLFDILNYKIKKPCNYNKGGFYMIYNTQNNKSYIGKSIDYLARLKQHLYKSTNKTEIDIHLNNNLLNFKFYIIAEYNEYKIDFFNRKLETIIEHTFITKYKTYYPYGYNIRHYGHLQIK